jgi:hypothetical protein
MTTIVRILKIVYVYLLMKILYSIFLMTNLYATLKSTYRSFFRYWNKWYERDIKLYFKTMELLQSCLEELKED